jgi:FkbM family methyltransferase
MNPQELSAAAETVAEISAGDTATAAVQPDIAKLLEAGLAEHRAGSLGKATDQYRQVLDVVPGHPDALYLLGVIAYQSDRPEMAIELIGKAIQQIGNNPAYHTGYGLALQSLTRTEEALESYDRALAIEPDNVEALNNRGLLLYELERFEEALENYDRALAVTPDFAKALNNRGNTLRALERMDEAVASYDRALAVEPNLTEANYNRAEVQRELKRSQLPIGRRDRSPTRQVTMLQVAPPAVPNPNAEAWSQLPLFFSALKARGFAPKHIMDVGANHGHWTRAALNYFPESYYTLIEPQDYLKEHVHDLLARGDGKIQWIGAGAGDKPGILRFTIAYRDDSSSFAISSEDADARGFRQIEVPVVTLNEVTRTSSVPFPEMVKIDAEGFDLRVIEGASELLGRTDIFILETLIFGQGWENTLENVMTTMSRAGYHIIDIPGLNRSPKYGVLWLCDLAFLRNESPILADVDSYE